MLPPTYSLCRQIQKLAESRANCTSTSTTAPPPYSSNPPRRGFIMTPSPMIEEDTSWDDPVVPITITIDSSIDVFGNNNTVILPSASSPKGIVSSSTDSDHSASSASTTSSQRGRATQISQMAAVIIAALKQAGGLTDDLGRTRPIQIGINSGIKIDGKSNTVCTGERQPRRSFASSPVAIGEKRRAESEPPAPEPPAKRRR